MIGYFMIGIISRICYNKDLSGNNFYWFMRVKRIVKVILRQFLTGSDPDEHE